MKISDTRTNKIIIKAYTNSEWDRCDFAVITLKDGLDGFLKWVERTVKIATAIAHEDKDFFELSFLENRSITNFYTLNEEQKPDFSFLDDEKGKGWDFVELSEEEENSFSEPEEKIICKKIIFDKNKRFYIKAFGKNSLNEFFTEELLYD